MCENRTFYAESGFGWGVRENRRRMTDQRVQVMGESGYQELGIGLSGDQDVGSGIMRDPGHGWRVRACGM